MKDKTKSDYRKLAANFYAKRLGDQPPSPKRLADALRACAGDYRPDYWRRLRNAIEFDQREKGHRKAADRVAGTHNPMTTDAQGKPLPVADRQVKPKRRAVHSINDQDERKLSDAVKAAEDRELMAALFIAKHLGCRPAEMPTITDQGDGRFIIHGAKRTGNRGADRTLIADEGIRKGLSSCVKVMQGANIGAVQDRLERLSKRLWPRRKARPTLYSYRHQMGSNLKASGMDRVAIAYTMGHQATESVERYGDRRAAKGSGGLKVQPDADELALSSVRQTHRAFGEQRNPEANVPPSLAAMVESVASEAVQPEPEKKSEGPSPAPDRGFDDFTP